MVDNDGDPSSLTPWYGMPSPTTPSVGSGVTPTRRRRLVGPTETTVAGEVVPSDTLSRLLSLLFALFDSRSRVVLGFEVVEGRYGEGTPWTQSQGRTRRCPADVTYRSPYTVNVTDQ